MGVEVACTRAWEKEVEEAEKEAEEEFLSLHNMFTWLYKYFATPHPLRPFRL